MSKQKLLFVITKGKWGGAQRYVYDLATNLPKKSFAVVVATGEGALLPARLTEMGIRTITLSSLKRDVEVNDDISSFFALLRLFRTEKPNIIHLNSSKAGGIGALAGRLAGVPKIIFTAHGFTFNESRPGWQKLLIKFLSWITILLCHQVIVINRREYAQIKNWPGVKNKIVLIYNGIKSINFLPQPEARDELQKLCPKLAEINRPETIWVGTIAELHRNKGLDYLVAAYPQAVIIGEGEERKNLTGHAYLVGAVPEATRCLKAFDIFVLPSRKEGLPYSIMEAGLAGLPVIASSVGGIPEIITSMESGILIKPDRPNEITSAIQFLLTHRDKMTQFGQALKKRVTKDFSTTRMVKQTTAVYNEANETKN
ncbi:MAG: glycosyltransferase [Patescibacteria group bacterium]